MRELDTAVELPVPPLTALRVLYGDAFFGAYHAACSADAAARVTPWHAGTRTRTVSFLKRLDMPAALAKVFGAWHFTRARLRPALPPSPSPPPTNPPSNGSISKTSKPTPSMIPAK